MEQSIKSHIPPMDIYVIGASLLIIASLAIRILFFPVVTADFTASISHWLADLANSPGLTAFMYPFADYSPLYLYILKLLTDLPVYGLYSVKFVSLMFDVLIAILTCILVKRSMPGRFSMWQIYAIGAAMFAIPTVVINSSVWGQCDSIYAAFVLLAIYFIFKEKPTYVALFFGVAFSFKLQSLFIFPIILAYLVRRRYTIANLLIIPVTFVITIIPAWLGSGSFWQWFAVYAKQSNEFNQLSLSAPTIYSLFDSSGYSSGLNVALSMVGVILAVVAAIWTFVLMSRRLKSDNLGPKDLMFLSMTCVILLPFLLPHMHERYFYLADIFAMIYAFYSPRQWYIAALVILSSLFSYLPFLSATLPQLGKYIVNESILGIIMLVVAAICINSARYRYGRFS